MSLVKGDLSLEIFLLLIKDIEFEFESVYHSIYLLLS